VGGQYYLVEEPQTKRSVSRLIWDIAVGMLAVSGTVLGGLALYEQRANKSQEHYGLSGLTANGSWFYDDIPAKIMPAPYAYGMHGEATVSFAGWLIAPDTANCKLHVFGQASQEFSATQTANISFSAQNPADFANKAKLVLATCTGGLKPSIPIFEAIYSADGKTANQRTALYYQAN
jgi:hypothetical protein